MPYYLPVSRADVETVLRCYPRIYLACHRRHIRDEQSRAVISAHQASVRAKNCRVRPPASLAACSS